MTLGESVGLRYDTSIDAGIDALERLIKRGTLSDAQRARVHALTRKFRMTDEEVLRPVLRNTQWLPDGTRKTFTAADLYKFLLDVRDRYEERGKYAPGARTEGQEEAPATRKLWITDEQLEAELKAKWPELAGPLGLGASQTLALLRDLRDRYEERGRYAPAAAREAEQPTEEVKP